MEKIRFMLDGCDISFSAEAPPYMTLKQLLEQCDRIRPDYCACGIRSWDPERDYEIELSFDYDDVTQLVDYVSCEIAPKGKKWRYLFGKWYVEETKEI